MLSAKDYVVGIGAQKSGTTWLFKYLSTRYEVMLSPLKEIHYFDARYREDLCAIWDKTYVNRFKKLVQQQSPEAILTDVTQRDLLDAHYDRVRMVDDKYFYQHHFEKRVKAHHQLFGEVTPSYAVMNQDGFRAMKETFRNCRVIFLMRDPVYRFWSRLKMIERDSAKFGRDYKAIDQFETELDDPQNIARSAYHKTLENLREVFEEREQLNMFYEELFDDRAVERLCEFLEMPFKPGDYGERVNVSESTDQPSPEMLKLAANRFDETYAYVEEFFDGRLPDSWRASWAHAKA